MANQVFTATDRVARIYQTRLPTLVRNSASPSLSGQWAPNLKLAKDMAKQAGRFRYDDEPALVVFAD
jgi:hypothetical protein